MTDRLHSLAFLLVPLFLTGASGTACAREEPAPGSGAAKTSAKETVTVSESADTAIPLAAAARAFEEARALSAADGGRLWGTPLHGPLLFADRTTRWVVANQPDEEGLLSERRVDEGGASVFVGILPPAQNIANTAVEWAGVRWTMVAWPLPGGRYERGRLLCHEMFHRIQETIGLPGRAEDNGHLGSREGRIWLRLEARALAEALIRDGDERETAIRDAAVFRMHRRSLFPDRIDDEQALELNEGLAEYTGLVMSGLPENVLRDRAAVSLEQFDKNPSFVRSFAYATGPAYGLLLDAAGADRLGGGHSWRRSLTPESDLLELLLRATGIEPPASPPVAAGASESPALLRAGIYDGDAVMAEENERAESAARREAEYRARFIDGPVLVLTKVADLRYSFNPNAVEALGDDGTVLLTARVTDMWGTLEVASGGVLMVRRNGIVERFVVPAPIDPGARPLTGDGWTLDLSVGWVLGPGDRDGDYTIVIR